MSAPSRFSASARVQLAMTSVLAATVVILVVLAYLVTARQLTAATDDLLTLEAEAYAAAIAGAPAGEPVAAATRIYLSARTGAGAGFDPVLLVRLDTARVISNTDLRLEDALPTTLGDSDPAFSDIEFDGASYRVLAVPLETAGTQSGTFFVALSTIPARETATRVALTLAAAGAFALALGVPLSYLATRRALRPLTQMAHDAAEVSHADPGRRITYDGPADELGSLSRSLNAMLDRLENAYGDQRRFVADASHELRTPVAVIRGNVELLRSKAVKGAEAAESLRMIESEATRMVRLLDDLLSLARMEGRARARFQPLEVSTLVEEVTARSRGLGDRTVTREGICDVWTQGDPDLLDQALANLVRNAVAHTQPGGHITLTCASTATEITVAVSDDGPGIPVDDLDRIFDRFYRAPGRVRDQRSGGAGLGLAIARRLVELHGGTLVAKNAEPHGACFVVTLPRLAQPS